MAVSKAWKVLVAAMVWAGVQTGVVTADAAGITQQQGDKVRANEPVVLYHGSADAQMTVGTSGDTSFGPVHHYSHDSHYSHNSHNSHYSHYSSRY